MAGDIAISLEIAKRSAKERNETWDDEVRILMLHGLLHLAGYDHEKDDGSMEREEMRLRKSLGLASGLIERSRASNSRAGLVQTDARQQRQRASSPRIKSKAERRP